MKNHFLPQFFIFTAIVLLFTLLFSQRGLPAFAADSAQVETGTVTPTMTVSPTVTPTISPTPGCDLMTSGDFIVSGGDGLQFTVTNNNPQEVYLTNTTLNWTDYYDPNMYVDHFFFGAFQYWEGDGYDSPTSQISNVGLASETSTDWSLDFDGYGNLYGQTHTIGPFSVELTFNNSCLVTASIPAVVGQISKPVEHQIFGNSDINKTNFEAKAWDTGVGTNNGAGINRVHIVILDPSGNVIVNRNDTTAPFCAWGNQNPCPMMLSSAWNGLPNGIYTMIVWGRSGNTLSWSPPHTVNFKLLRTLPSPTLTPRPTP